MTHDAKSSDTMPTAEKDRPQFDPNQFVSRAEWRSGLEAINETLNEIKHEYRSLRREVGDFKERRTDWRPVGIVVSIGTFVLGAFGAVIAWGLMSNLDKLDKRTDVLESSNMAVISSRYTEADGKAESEMRANEVRRLEGLVVAGDRALDESLQREMRLLDEKGKASVDALTAQIERLEAQLDARRAWAAEHDRVVSAINARQDTRIDEGDEEHAEHVEMTHELRKRVGALEIELARRATTVDRVEAEQSRRNGRVYQERP